MLQLAHSPDCLIALIKASPDVVRILTIDGRVEYMNKRGQDLLEITDFTTCVDRFLADLWPSESRRRISRALGRAQVGKSDHFVAACPTAKGRMRWWSNVVTPVLDETDRVVRLLVTSRDVTKERRQKAQIKRAQNVIRSAQTARAAERLANANRESFYQKLVEIMPAFLIVKDARNGSFVLVNPAAESALGIDPRTCIGKTVADIFPGEEAEASAEEDRFVIESRQVSIDASAPITIASGELKYYTTKKVAVFDGDEPVHIVTAGQDVTEQVVAQEGLREALKVAEGANAAKSQFLANMSHELRTPLNGIIAMADMLLGSQADDRCRQMAETIVASGRMLEYVVNDILDVAKIEAGQMKLAVEPFDLKSVLTKVCDLHSAAAAVKGVRLDCFVDPEAFGSYLGDETRVAQVVSNLLGNAVKFTEQGQIRLSARVNRLGLRLRVSDTGSGFDRATAGRLFGRFEQADVSISRRHGGTGLGLSICKSLSTMMGGRISARSAPGKGSLFVVSLPLTRLQECEVVTDEPATLAPVEPSETPNMRILFADDHEVNRRVVSMILEPLGVDLVIVENGQLAVDAASVSVFDLILMDVQMPVMDGLTATRQIRKMEIERGLAPTPVISLTANAMPDDVKRSLDAGSDLHLPKPVRPDTLIKAICDLTAGTREAPRMVEAA